MSFVSDIFGGDDAAEASEDAAATQARSAEKAIEFQREALETIRGDLAPFRELGTEAISAEGPGPSLVDLVRDPRAQREFVEESPFFKSLADQAQRRIFSNQAARGKVGSGGTAEALQNSLLLLGSDLVSQNVGQRLNLASVGESAAAQTGVQTGQAGRTISDLITQQGNVLGAGQVGAANARQQATSTGLNTIIGLGGLAVAAFSDRRLKTNIKRLCSVNGHMRYLFKYIGDVSYQVGVMAQEVEQIKPDAVGEIGGMKFVNYGAL